MAHVLTVTVNPALDVFSRTQRIVPIHKLRCDHVQRQPGGGGVNVARVLHRLGVHVQALLPLGGTTGDLMAELLRQEGIALTAVPIAGHTRESFTVAEGDSGQEYRFVLPGPELSESEWMACLAAAEAVTPQAAWVVASGSLPPGAPVDFYGRLALQCRSAGQRLIVDTSGAALQAALDAGVYMVKPSLGEMRSLSGASLESLQDIEAVAKHWIQQGKAGVVVVSLGERGALFVTQGETLIADAVSVTVVSAVGAGDSFVAGMVAGLVQGHSLADAFRWGVATASVAIQGIGMGAILATDVQALLRRVTTRPMHLMHV